MAESQGRQDVPSKGHAIWLACVIAPIFTGVFIALRAYAKVFVTKKVHLNDCEMTLQQRRERFEPQIDTDSVFIGVAFLTLIWVLAFSGTLAQGMSRSPTA